MSHADELAAPDGERSVQGDEPLVLIVDDDGHILGAHARTLAREGYRIETAQDADAALAALRRISFDVVVSDIAMPRMSGIELVERMRSDGTDIPVILVTGDPQLATAVKAIEHGVLRYLSKPVERGALVRVVGEVVRLHGIARAKRLALDNEGLRSLIEELNRSKDAAETASRAKTAFLGKMSHELRTPMTAIIGMTELALDTKLTREQREYLETVRTSADSLLGLIQDILDVADLDGDRVLLEAMPFSVRDVIRDVLERLGARSTEKGVALTSECGSNVPATLSGDAARLRQVLTKLIGNAVKFTRFGEVKIRAELESRSKKDAFVRVSVADTGIGIPEEKLASVFDAFSQVDDSMSREYGGAGLGLAIASQLVRLMGGVLKVRSTPGVGTKFQFTARFGHVEGATEDAHPQINR
jgi:signal transduction histidine kinase